MMSSTYEEQLMARVATRSKDKEKTTTIDESIKAFLIELRSNFPAQSVENAAVILGMLRNYLDDDDQMEESASSFCQSSAPASMIKRLDRFLRYTVMRELVLSFQQQEFVFFVTYDFCEWLKKKGLLPDNDYQQFQDLRDGHLKMWKQAGAVAEEIAFSLQRTKSAGRSSKTIEFARHDVLKIEGDQIWLDIWSPLMLPDETKIGPILLPGALTDSLQVGWMVTCELKKFKSEWRITDIGNIYPSLPF